MKTSTLLLLLAAVLPPAFLAIIYADLPARIPLHYNLKMEVDRIGHKSELCIVTGILTVVSVLLFFILTNFTVLTPREEMTCEHPLPYTNLHQPY